MASPYGSINSGAAEAALGGKPGGDSVEEPDEGSSILRAGSGGGGRAPAEPEIRLETLSAFATRGVLATTYAAFGLAVLAGMASWVTTPSMVVPPQPCVGHGAYNLSGCTVFKHGGSEVLWTGATDDLPLWSPLFELDASFVDAAAVTAFVDGHTESLGPDDQGLYLVPLHYDAVVKVREREEDDWVELLNSKNSSTHTLCTRTACEDARLLSPYGSAGGLGAGGGHAQYGFEIAFLGEEAALMATGVAYRFYYERPALYLLSVGLRCALLATTVIFACYWLYKCRQHQPVFARWIDERKWVACFLLCLLLFQNPVFTVAQFYAHVTTATHIASSTCEALAQAGFLTLWLVYMDGLRSTEHAWPSFYAGKIGFGLLTAVVSMTIVVLDVLTPAPALSSQWQGEPGTRTYHVFVVCGGVLAALNFVWFCWFVWLMLRTGRALTKRHYMRTRHQQLPYRFFVFQAILALLYVLVYYVLQAYTFFVGPLVRKDVGFVDAWRLTWEAASSSALAGWAQSSYQPISKVIFVSVSAYLLAFVYLPPWRKPKAGAVSNFHVQWEHELLLADRKRIDRRRIRLMPSHPAKSGADEGQVFCLETACLLLDVAWEAYNYIPGTGGSLAGAGYAGVDVERLGFRVVAFLQRSVADVHVLVVRGHGRIVVAFRGTASPQNWLTDLKVAHEVLRIELDTPKFVVRRNQERHDAVMPANPLARMLRNARNTATHAVGSAAHVAGGVADRIKHVVAHIPGAQLVLPRVHSGFWEAYCSVREELNAVIRECLETEYAPLYVTGHSMGGAIASLCAYDVSSNMDLPNEVVMYNFGSPRCGNVTFVGSYNERVPCSFRCVVDGDIVTGVPSLVGMYQHVGTEVVFDGAGNLLVDPSFVETIFGTKARRSVASHSMYQYRDGLHACFAASSQVRGQDLVDEFEKWGGHSDDVW